MSIITTPERTVDEVIDALQIACSRVADSVGVMHAARKRLNRVESAVGTAYCVDKRGYFVTALHVVQGEFSSFIAMEQVFETRLVAVDEKNDLALMQVVEPESEFIPVIFATSVEDGEIVSGLGYPDCGMSVELCANLARYAGLVVDGVGPNGLILDGDTLQSALAFVGTEAHTQGYSGGPIVNADGAVVASTVKGDDDGLGLIIGPSAATILAFIEANLPDLRRPRASEVFVQPAAFESPSASKLSEPFAA
jgi:S1-C subfamily serine protease